MNIAKISQRLADAISVELGYDNDKKEILAYGIESIILAIFGISVILLLAFPFNALIPAGMAAIFGGALRKVSGGAHFNTPFKCLIIGAIIYTLLGITAKQIVSYNLNSMGIFFIILLFSLIIIVLWAPVDSEAKPIHSSSFRRKLKIASIGFVIIAWIIILLSNNNLINTGVALGIAYQSITLLPVFNKKKKEVKV